MIRLRPLCILSLIASTSAALAAPQPAPKLAVAISIDQFRADYLERFEPYFGKGGFRRLLDQGSVFTEARHRHALTATAPGHATLLSGSPPSVHGIVANSWLDPENFERVGAVSDPDEEIIGAKSISKFFPIEGTSPRNFLATSVGDQLKLRHGDASRVISLSNKDRAAILMGGHHADAAYWLPTDRFVTSTFYVKQPPAWLETFNREHSVDSFFGQTWDRLLPVEVYNRVQGPDVALGEESRLGLGATFPRTLDGGLSAPGEEYYKAFRIAPQATTLLGNLATSAIQGEQLGQRSATDLLCISFSQTDYVGHSFGSDSHEIMDTVIRLDRVLAELFSFLDETIGQEGWIVVVSADHGGCPLPERATGKAKQLYAGRLDWTSLQATAEEALAAAFGPPPSGSQWLLRDAYGFRLVKAPENALTEMRRTLRDALLSHPQIASAWTREELLGNSPESNHWDFEAWHLSYHIDRSPDVVFTPRPYVVDRSPYGSNHGTPHDYDCHVPLIFFGPGIPSGHYSDPVNTEQLAPTLSRLLQVPRPPQADQALLPHIFQADN
ncbi:alkaline phosphatase family protein [Pelagicoccus enzymogenes]|uniref:alkaline phosphatase family protein n=1 Tax=Pelagicoccus enzymogenes TaxID=2773457 RepID=UPI00280EE2B6|nr:alkaline phosphatase family protein [Pelagicoccus enzymogenes]MDQ8199758.1 alkaline phosphatase family protein [Pelagicoccus enzymogenes]